MISDKVGPKMIFFFFLIIMKLISGRAESWNSDILTPQKYPHKRMLTRNLYNGVERKMSGLEFKYS